MDVEDMEPGVFYPWPDGVPFDRSAIRYAMATRTRTQTMIKRSTGRAAKNEAESRARKIIAEGADRDWRASDPYEQAKAFLQRKGYRVFSRSVCDPPKPGITVGARVFQDVGAVMQYATSLGWKPLA